MKYYLLPFKFTRIGDHEILVNEVGDMLHVPIGTAEQIVNRTIEDQELYKTLVANFFISETRIPALLDVYAERLAEKKRFLDDYTALHIFVLTLRCNQLCVYCQASSQDECVSHATMSMESMRLAVQHMFKSRSQYLTMEFQGGEPSLEPALIHYGIELAEQLNETEKRHLTYVLCTNSINLTDEVLGICKQYNVLISTSLDGPSFLHNTNRGKQDSYERVVKGIAKAREVLGADRVSALMTASERSLNYPTEIVDEYHKLGFSSIFLRALNPYGKATENADWEAYTDRFIEFYKQAFEHIIELNKQGHVMIEEYAAIILRKLLTPWCTGFVDLQSPAGIVNSVLIYNYDGYMYASDESRMLAEEHDYTFRIGKLSESYENLVYSPKVKEWAKVWNNEAIAGCADCALQAYCGADPVRNHTTQNDLYGFRPTSLFCKKNKAIIEYIISCVVDRNEELMPIFRNWIR